MLSRILRTTVILAVSVASTAIAQVPVIPSPAQAQQMLKTDPMMIQRLQQMMAQSGMTPDQVRSRLRAQGYPDSLLDQYLPGGKPDSLALPDEDVFAAVRSLGVGDSLVIDSLRNTARSRRGVRLRADSAFMDTVQRALMHNDTLMAAMRALIRSKGFQRDMADSGYKVFGLDLFTNHNESGPPNTFVGADPNYRFGPGDRLTLFLTGDIQKSMPLTVTREGLIIVPDAGAVNVVGMTRAELETALRERLGRVYSTIRTGTTKFYVDVSQMGTNQIFVNGDVREPASYQVPRSATIMSALYQAGGPTPNGSMRNVLVKRNGQTVATLDVYDYALGGNSANDIRLENGDIVLVPPRGPQVRIAGFVLRPATYEIKPTETIADAIRMAGGFAEAADTRSLQVERILPANERKNAGSDRKILTIDSDLFATTPVRGGDVIRVREVAKRVADRINVRGNVWAPGVIGFTPGLTLYDAFRRVGGLKPDSYLGQVLISRLKPDSSRQMLRTAVFDTTGRPVDNIALADGDEITVFSTTDMRPSRYITVNGAVKKPGEIPYREGMTLHDAVLLAGGLLESASLSDAEVARLPENRAAGITAVTTQVSLDSSFVTDGTDGGGHTQLAPTFVLKPYDAVLIKQQPGWQLQQSVAVEGEVLYPGRYALVRKNETLVDIIKRAGGLTPYGYPGGIVFVRHGHNRNDDVGRIGVDLPRVLSDSNFVDNLQLADGDSIFIPRYAAVVTVRGAVNSPVGVAYVPGANLDYYVRSSGGASTRGDAGQAYVTQPNGKVETKARHLVFFTSQPKPQPGSTVFVPDKDTNNTDYLQVLTALTTLAGSVVAIAAILRR